jgi:tetratricopeptide (TPR) repeat protein
MPKGMIVRLLAAATVVLVALDGGGYALESRTMLGVAVWWTIAVGFVAGVLPRRRAGPAALAAVGLLAGLAIVALASSAWGASAEAALAEFDRAALYVGVLVLAVALAGGRMTEWLADGLGVGIAAVVIVALTSRFLPDLVSPGEAAAFLPSAATRLSYPVDYWNGLAILAALGVPLLLRAAVGAASPALRGLAVATLPAVAVVVYLASSRGGAATAIVGGLAFLALAGRRAAAAGALAAGAVGAAVAIALLAARPELVDGPLGSSEAADQGRSAAVLLVLVCALTGLAYGLGARILRSPRLPRAVAWSAAAVGAAAIVAAAIAAEPVEGFRTFKEPPGEFVQPRPDFVRAHLLSGGGSGRWQFWAAAVDAFETRPLVGRGAGTYEAWWAEHGSLAYFVRDAHSLYAETLGELGLLGLALLLGSFAAGLAGALVAVRAAEEPARTGIAAPAAAFVAYAVAAGFDWMWELTAVSIVGLACLGLAAAGAAHVRAELRSATAAGVAAVALVAVTLQAVPLLGELRLDESRAAVRRGEPATARESALAARDLQPWATSPYLQLALVDEEAGDLRAARRAIGAALERDSADWRLWLVAARLETKAGAIAAARRSLDRARALNPRSPLFANES